MDYTESKEFFNSIDALSVALGGIFIKKKDVEGLWHIVFYNQVFNNIAAKYSTLYLELLAIVNSLWLLQHLLLGLPFIVYIAHKPL